jgi:chorismate synthase
MVALVLADHLLTHFAQCELLPRDSAAGIDTKVATQFRHLEVHSAGAE